MTKLLIDEKELDEIETAWAKLRSFCYINRIDGEETDALDEQIPRAAATIRALKARIEELENELDDCYSMILPSIRRPYV